MRFFDGKAVFLAAFFVPFSLGGTKIRHQIHRFSSLNSSLSSQNAGFCHNTKPSITLFVMSDDLAVILRQI